MLDSVTQDIPTAAPVTVPVETQPYSKRQELLQELMNNSELLFNNRLEVRHLMTRHPEVVLPTTTLEEMNQLMLERRLHHLLVCNRGGDLVGVISDRDFRAMRGTTAQQVMSYPPMTCEPDTPVGSAITFLMNKHISCLPVVDHGQLCGVLTTTDLVLTMQCMMQLWLRVAQVLQHDTTWLEPLEEIAESLKGPTTAEQLAEHIKAARRAIHKEVQHLLNVVDLRTDAMTGVRSRRDLDETLSRLLAMKRRHKRPFSLAVVVVNHFERIQATCGAEVVKPLVKAVARFLEKAVRETDIVARCRKDAFAVVLTETGSDQAAEFCRRLTEAARRNTDLDVELRISAGAVEAEADETAAALLARAEAAVHV